MEEQIKSIRSGVLEIKKGPTRICRTLRLIQSRTNLYSILIDRNRGIRRGLLAYTVDLPDDPALVARMLASEKNGAEIAWLTSARLAKRFMNPRYAAQNDKLARYGL